MKRNSARHVFGSAYSYAQINSVATVSGSRDPRNVNPGDVFRSFTAWPDQTSGARVIPRMKTD